MEDLTDFVDRILHKCTQTYIKNKYSNKTNETTQYL